MPVASLLQNSKPLNVLLIEDNMADYVLVREAIASMPYQNLQLQWAENFDDGLKRLLSGDYDVCLLDYRLGPDDGLDLLSAAVNQGCTTPIIFLTGYDDYQVDLEAMRRGAVDYVPKSSLNPSLLERAIRYALAHWRSTQRLQESLREKDVLLVEIHHRVKNNLQIISSMLKLQGRRIQNDEARSVLDRCCDRVRSMALIHDKLYHSKNVSAIDFGEFLPELANDLLHSHGIHPGRISLKLECKRALLTLESAVPCGLIVNELISNAFKHAFPQDRKGEILLKFEEIAGNRLQLIVADNGVGASEQQVYAPGGKLGLELVRSFVRQLSGELEEDYSSGARFSVTFHDHKVEQKDINQSSPEAPIMKPTTAP